MDTKPCCPIEETMVCTHVTKRLELKTELAWRQQKEVFPLLLPPEGELQKGELLKRIRDIVDLIGNVLV